jgi:putative ABC transport system ATP-binding protein
MIQLNGVTKTYKMGDETIYALRDVSLKIEQGDFLAITGPSGSGKSTLATIIGGLDTPDSGSVTIGEQTLKNASDTVLSYYRNKKIGFVFQTFNLQPNYTALENVMIPLILGRVKGKERVARAKDCLKAVGLDDRMNHKPGEMSGGQRQRVAIARALANSPEIIIADEPTGNLDSAKGEEIITLLENLNKQNKITLIMVTHDLAIAKRAHKVIEIHDGKIR